MAGGLLLNIIVWIVFGAICAAIAQSRGRSAVGWFVIGALTSCIGLILVLVLPDLKAQQEREERMRRENRRLRERLRKDRVVADQRHDATVKRLDVHDEALGVDTGRAPTALPESSSPQSPPSDPSLLDDGTEWYYLEGQDRVGPLSVVDLRILWRDRSIGPETLVWCSSMADWAALSTVSKLRKAIDE